MDEPRYIDDGDEFVEEDSGWKHPESLTNSDLIQECMRICGRTILQFKSPKEARLWKQIDSKINSKRLHPLWIKAKAEEAQRLNYGMLKISMEELGRRINNIVAHQEWQRKHPELFHNAGDY